MKIILALILMLLLTTPSHATLTAGIVPVTKTGGSSPVLQNGSITDTGTASGAGNVGVGSANPGQALDVVGTVRNLGEYTTGSIYASTAVTGGTKYNVKECDNVYAFCAQGNGVMHFDGTASTGASSTTFTSATGTFTSNDIGKVISIVGAGAAGVDLTTTIAAVASATSITLTVGVSTSVSGVNYVYGTDDTAAFNTVLALIGTNKQGTLYAPAGIYVINGSFGSNNQLLSLPFVASATPIFQQTVNLEGESWNANVESVSASLTPTTQGTILYETTLGTGAQSFLAPSTSGSDFIWVGIKNITFRTTSNPQLSAINIQSTMSFDIKNIIIDTAGIDSAHVVQPTDSSSYGLNLPGIGNSTFEFGEGITVTGFYTAIWFNEHTVLDNVLIDGCIRGLYATTGNHSSMIKRILAQNTTYPVYVHWIGSGTAFPYFYINQLAIEHDTNQNWQETIDDYYDNSGIGLGEIDYHVVAAGVGTSHLFTISAGGTLMHFKELGIDFLPHISTGNVGIGSYTNYFTNTTLYPRGTLDVEGTISPTIFNGQTNQNVGVATYNPQNRLSVAGGVSIGSAANVGIASAPSNGLYVQGNLDIGTTVSAATLDVPGTLSTVIFGNNVGIGTNLDDSTLGIKGNNGSSTVGPVVCLGKSSLGQDCIGKCTSISTDTCNCTCL